MLSFNQPTDSWYHVSAGPGVARPALDGDLSCDVAVVGGGLTGCSTALHLAQRGYRVVLLEGATVGYGASGRSGAQLLPGFASGQGVLRAALGAAGARAAFNLSIEGMALSQRLIRDHAIECDYRVGQAHVAVKPRQALELLAMQRELEALDYPHTRLLEQEELGQLLATTRYRRGLFDSHSAHLHPLKKN